MPVADSPLIKLVRFKNYENGIMAVRKAVFVDELGIDPQLEWDQKDEQACYAIAIVNEEIIGVGRLLQDGQIGRVAILPGWRRQGTGRRIIRCLIDAAQQAGRESVYLSAQLDALHFYDTLGFTATGEPFLAAGIPHQRMSLVLPSPVVHI